MLHAVDDERLGAAANVQDAFDPQHVLTAQAKQQLEPGIEHGVWDRLLDEDGKRLDAVVVAIHVMDVVMDVIVIVVVTGAVVMAVSLILILMRVRTLRLGRIRIGLLIQPTRNIRDLAGGIEQTQPKQVSGDDLTLLRFKTLRGRVDALQALLNRRGLRRADEIALGQQQAIGHRRLLHRFRLRIERRLGAGQINRGHHAIEAVTPRDHVHRH